MDKVSADVSGPSSGPGVQHGPGSMRQLFGEAFAPRRGISRKVLESVGLLAIELAREGREGKKVGALFVVGDSEAVLDRSYPLILDPLAGHPLDLKKVEDANLRETLKELSLLDGAFIISSEGVAISACRYLDASSKGVQLPSGLGARHMAGASITKQTAAISIVVSQSSLVRVFDDGELITEIVPELWMLRRFSSQIAGPADRFTGHNVTVLRKKM